MIRTLSISIIVALAMTHTVAAAPETFVVTDSVANHLFARQSGHSTHVVRFKQGDPTLLVAFPGGNAGAVISFPAGTPLGAAQVTYIGPRQDGQGSKAEVAVTIGTNQATVGSVTIGSLREIRRRLGQEGASYETEVITAFEEAFGKLSPEQRGLLESRGLFPTQPRDSLSNGWRAGTVGDRRIVHQRRSEFLGDKDYGIALSLPGNCQALGGQKLRLSCPADEAIELVVEVTVPHRPLTPLKRSALLHPEARAYLESTALKAAGPEVVSLLDRAEKSLSFLAYEGQLLAGSFRYLTYFGRDTLLAVRMLLPVAGEELLDAALQSVCDRLSPDGRVAHEEAVGNEAILLHMARFAQLVGQGQTDAAIAELSAYGAPVFDYSMVDDDFLLLPLVRDLLVAELPVLDDEARLRLLKGPSGTRLTCLARNLEYVLLMASAEDLLPYGIPLAEGRQVGNWRDSQEGLGGGKYPGDVNAYLAPAALVAAGEIVTHPLAAKAGLLEVADARDYGSLYRIIHDPDWLDSLLRRYETVAEKYRVVLHLPHLRSAVKRFLQESSDAVKGYFAALEIEPGCNLATFSRGHCYPAELAAGLPAIALALDKSGAPISVLHSDGVLALFDNPMPVDQLEGVLKAFSYPYPLGLWTDVGPVVANALATGSPRQVKEFGNDRYHGAVVWGWVVGMLELGLQRQQAFLQQMAGDCGTACDEVALLASRLDTLRRRIPALAANELWTWNVAGSQLAPIEFGAKRHHATQSNPAQLWSTVWLSVYYSTRK